LLRSKRASALQRAAALQRAVDGGSDGGDSDDDGGASAAAVAFPGGPAALRASCRVAAAATDVLFAATLWATRAALRGCVDDALLEAGGGGEEVRLTARRALSRGPALGYRGERGRERERERE
jgi:hypothetical protein